MKVKQRKRSLQHNVGITAKYIINGLRPKAIIGRVNGPKVLINSIPKSGTNLLGNVLWYMPSLRRFWGRTIMPDYSNHTATILSRIRCGQYAFSHLPCNDIFNSAINDNKIMVLFMIRDPRDIVISYANYVTYIDIKHKSHIYFSNLKNDSQRISTAIRGEKNIVEPIADILEKYSPWLNYPNTLVVKYEDLIGPKGGGDINRLYLTLEQISDFLKINLSKDKISNIADNVYSTNSPTFHSSQIGKWKNRFNADHHKLFNESVHSLMKKYKYYDY